MGVIGERITVCEIEDRLDPALKWCRDYVVDLERRARNKQFLQRVSRQLRRRVVDWVLVGRDTTVKPEKVERRN